MCFDEAEFNFTNKLVLISGANGQGKSAIFDAISLCFSSKKRSVSYQDYVKQGKDTANIVLDCIINNNPVHFEIQLNLSKGTPFDINLTIDNKTYHNKETEEIIESFGLDYYSNLIFSMQNDNDITSLTPAQRAYYLQNLLNFDFEKQKEHLKNNISQFDTIIKSSNTEIPIKENFIKKEESSFEVLKEVPELNLLELTTKIENKEKELEESEKKMTEFYQSKEKISVLQNKIVETNSSIKLQYHYAKEIQSKKDSIQSMLKEKEDSKLKIEEYKKSILNLTNEQNENKQLLLEIDSEISEIKKLIDDYNKANNELNRLCKVYEEDKCPFCGQETKDAIEEQFNKYISSNELFSFIQNKSSLLDTKDEVSLKLSSFNSKLKDLEAEKSNIVSNKETLELALMGKKSLLNGACDRIQIIDDFIKNSNFKDELEEKNLIILNLQMELRQIELEKISYEEEIKNFVEIKLSEISKEISLLKNKKSEYESLLDVNKNIELRNKKRQENIDSLKLEIETLKNKNRDIILQKDIFEEAYKIFNTDLPNFMTIKACFTLQDSINSFIQDIFPQYEVLLQASKKGCEFFYTKDSSIKESKKKNNFLLNTRMSSGFEKNLLTLAFKVSLAKLYNCDCCFLDEADGAADEYNTQLLYNNIINLEFNQIFLITHKEFVKEFLINNYPVDFFEIKNGKVI